RPAAAARLLPMNMALGEPCVAPATVQAALDVAELPRGILDEAVACEQAPIRGHAEITCARAARIRTVGASVDLMQGLSHVGERVPASGDRLRLEFPPALDHFLEHRLEIRLFELETPRRSTEHRREADAVEAKADQPVQRLAQPEV